MADITWDDVVDFAAELSTFDADAAAILVDYANQEAFDASNFGGEDAKKYHLARVLLVAHQCTMSGRGGAAGPVTSSSAGKLSRSFSVTSAGSSTYGQTSYGSLLKELISTTPARLGWYG